MEPKRPSRPINITSLVRLSTTVPNTIVVSWTAEIGRVSALGSLLAALGIILGRKALLGMPWFSWNSNSRCPGSAGILCSLRSPLTFRVGSLPPHLCHSGRAQIERSMHPLSLLFVDLAELQTLKLLLTVGTCQSLAWARKVWVPWTQSHSTAHLIPFLHFHITCHFLHFCCSPHPSHLKPHVFILFLCLWGEGYTRCQKIADVPAG